MQGASRSALAEGDATLGALLDGSPLEDLGTLADQLFGIADAIDGSSPLRRALTDASRTGDQRAQLARRLLADKVSDGAMQVLTTLVHQRWSADRDLVAATEQLAVACIVAKAERAGRADQLEDELFRFERLIDGNAGLQQAFADRRASAADRVTLVTTLLSGKATAETIRLVTQAARAPRGRKVAAILAEYLQLAQIRRDQLAALATSAVALEPGQQERLTMALQRIYGKQIHLAIEIDPAVIGGIRVRVGDDVFDGSIARRLDAARRHFS